MGDILWIMLLVLWPIFLLLHVIKWSQGRSRSWRKSDCDQGRLVPRIHGVGPMFDEFVHQKESRRRRNLD